MAPHGDHPILRKGALEMNRAKRPILFLILVIVLLAVSTSLVFAKELGLLTISGPGIKGEVTLKDPDDMIGLEKSGFFDQAILAKPPKDLGEGYNITAHLNLDGKMVPMAEMVYYPLNEGQPGYVHYTARLNGESLQTVDEWHILSRAADTALRDLMVANSITVQSALITAPAAAAPVVPAEEPAAPAVSPVSVQISSVIVAVALLLLAGAVLVLRRRTASRTTT